MSWLNPGVIALAAALTIPPLVLLYFLKLKRAPQTVSSTLLWKRAIEDLQVNAPFQRMRNSLLFWLQLLVLLIAALALGQPMLEAIQQDEDTVVVLIDQSASMAVEERPGESRLDIAKQQARTVIDNLPTGSQAMVIGFCDRATMVSAFTSDRDALKSRIDEIDPTDSTTTLSEALTLAEAYMQNLVIAGDGEQPDIEVTSTAQPARAIILTDGNIADAGQLAIKRLPTEDMQVITIGQRADNVAILSMDTRRNYERPAQLEVFALVRNFGPAPVQFDINLYINNNFIDLQTVRLEAGQGDDPVAATVTGAPAPGSAASITFDDLRLDGGGVVELRLVTADALATDNVARTIVQPPRDVSVLLVTRGNVFLERLLRTLPISVEVMSPEAFEGASENDLQVVGRSRFDVVVFDRHSTDRLPPGSYLFMGGVPLIDEVGLDGIVRDEVIFNWDESHPTLRYVAIDTIRVFEWSRLTLPTDATLVMEGETSPVLAVLPRDGRLFLLCAFSLLTEDDVTGELMLNTDWVVKAHFPVFFTNALQFLAGSLSPTGVRSVSPGQPLAFPAPAGARTMQVIRPDGTVDTIDVSGFADVNYARTRRVGLYRAEPGVAGRDRYAVNLFAAGESDTRPREGLQLGGQMVASASTVERVNKPLWPYALMALLVALLLEWAVYSRRVYV